MQGFGSNSRKFVRSRAFQGTVADIRGDECWRNGARLDLAYQPLRPELVDVRTSDADIARKAAAIWGFNFGASASEST